MKRLLYITAAVALALAAAISAVAFNFPKIAVGVFEAVTGLDVKYDKMLLKTGGSLAFDGLTITDSKKGLGIFSKDATVMMLWNGPDPRKAALAFDLKVVHFIKVAKDGAPSYDTLDGLVALPFDDRWIYDELSGKVSGPKGDIVIRDFMAKSPQIRLSFNGEMTRTDKIRSDIVIYFAESLTSKIPPELTKLVLKDEPDGWKSLTVKLDGDFRAPSIQVSSKLFRLNINVKND